MSINTRKRPVEKSLDINSAKKEIMINALKEYKRVLSCPLTCNKFNLINLLW